MHDRRIKPFLSDKQKIAMRNLVTLNGVTEIVYGGAAGGGKSYLGCLWLITQSIKYPRTRWLMGRARLKDLRLTTYASFKKVASELGLVQGIDWKMNGQTNVITFFNGSEIIMKDLFQYPSDSDFDGLGSLEITGAFIDEFNQIVQKAKDVVMSRIREGLDENGLEPKLLMTCNPAKNWVYNDYYKPWFDGKLEPHIVFIQAKIEDNPKISRHYKNNLDKMKDRASRARLRDGLWEYSDELSMFDFVKIQEGLNRKRKLKDGLRCFISVDVARLGKDKSVIWVADEKLNILELVEIEKGRTKDVIKAIRKLQEKYDVDEYDIAIDSDGVGGGVADAFENAEHIVNNSKALNGENYYNLKTQLYFRLAEVFNESEIGFNNVPDLVAEKISQELQILRREKVEMDGKVCMTSKKDVKANIGRSPDYSDALAYLMIFFLDEFDDGYISM